MSLSRCIRDTESRKHSLQALISRRLPIEVHDVPAATARQFSRFKTPPFHTSHVLYLTSHRIPKASFNLTRDTFLPNFQWARKPRGAQSHLRKEATHHITQLAPPIRQPWRAGYAFCQSHSRVLRFDRTKSQKHTHQVCPGVTPPENCR